MKIIDKSGIIGDGKSNFGTYFFKSLTKYFKIAMHKCLLSPQNLQVEKNPEVRLLHLHFLTMQLGFWSEDLI